MKKIAIFTILLIIILGCSKNEEEILTVSSYSYINETSPYDTSIRVSVEEINGILKIRIYQNQKVAHERNLYAPKSENVDLGYGEVETIPYTPYNCLFLKEHILLYWNAHYVNTHNKTHTYTMIYTNKLDSIATVTTIGVIKSSNFGEDKFIIHDNSENKNIVYDSTGKIIFEKMYYGETYEWPTCYHNIAISNTEFLDWGEYNISRKCLDKGLIWSNTYNELIPNKPVEEINPPKIELIEHSLKSNVLNSIFNVTYYSGEKEKVSTKIDINTGSIINN